MLEILTQQLLWWHWIVFGIFLITLEIFTGTFILLGLGLSAMLVGLIDHTFHLSIEMELTLWMMLSLLSLLVWFKFFKNQTVENAGQSNYALETQGRVEKKIESNGRGTVRFDRPLLGNTLWIATSKEAIETGSRVKIIAIKGQLIEVAKI